jgi:dTDP-glucose 4,6-dehydratase
MRILVTGGAGFIGSHFARRACAADDVETVTVLDAMTYAAHRGNLGDDPKLTFVEGNICDRDVVGDLARRHDAIVHFAAESHVDRSFVSAMDFLRTNVLGTQSLLEAARRHAIRKFVHCSTDEVYGPVISGAATEADPLRPTVPYASSKAASDLLALSAYRTFGVPVCITRSSNNYGPHQYPEKIIPLFVTRLLQGQRVTLHGCGEHVRNWLHVEDNCAGVDLVLRRGIPGEIYNLGGGTDMTGTELTERLLRACGAGWDVVDYVPDRRCNDIRYAMDWSKAANDLGYCPAWTFTDGLAATVTWYRDHPERWKPLPCNRSAPRVTVDTAGEPRHA